MAYYMNISKEATDLLLEIIEHEKAPDYWSKRFEGLNHREDTILRGCFSELINHNMINVLWADNCPYAITILKDGYLLEEQIRKTNEESMNPFEKGIRDLLNRTKTIKSPINAASIGTSIAEYNKPSNIWINDFEIFYNKHLKDHPLSKRIETILFHRKLDAYNNLVAILESISKDSDYFENKTIVPNSREENMKDYEILLRKLIPRANKDDLNILLYTIEAGERPLFGKLENDGYIKNVKFRGHQYVDLDLTYEGLHYFDEKREGLSANIDPKPRKMYDVFLSHASKDKITYVEELKQTLDILGVQVFYDKDTIEWGDAWKQKIYEGLEKSEFAIMVISENFFDREWTELELKELLERQNEEGQKLILPILHNITPEQLKAKYPKVADIQAIESKNNSYEKIALLFARQLIKRYK